MRTRDEMIKLGLSMAGHGYHYSAWLHPDSVPDGPSRFDYYLDLTRTAEQGLFDLVFLADLLVFSMADTPKGVLGRRGDNAGLEPLTLLAALAPMTTNIGLVATSSTTFSHPFHVARFFASIDRISKGRVGWNVVTSSGDDEAENFGESKILQKNLRYERAREFVDVVTGLWDSFDSDTFVASRSNGVFFDPSKVRLLNHRGKYFSVKGPLNIGRSPQGRPIIVQAGASEEGQELAARSADIVYTLQTTKAGAVAFYNGLKARTLKCGRDPDSLKIMPGIVPIVGETMKEARRKHDALLALVDPLVGLEYLNNYFGDLSRYPLDEPVPELATNEQMPTRARVLMDIARREQFSIRQLFQHVSISNAHCTIVGTPEKIADVLEEWFNDRGADGFNILPVVSPTSVREFVHGVVPELQRRGCFRQRYEGLTLRQNLGLENWQASAESGGQLRRHLRHGT